MTGEFIKNNTKINKDDLEHQVLNQLETDFQDQAYDALSEMLQILMRKEENMVTLYEYLSDSGQENLLEGKTTKKY